MKHVLPLVLMLATGCQTIITNINFPPAESTQVPPPLLTPKPPQVISDEQAEIEQAIYEAISTQEEFILPLLIYETKVEELQVSSDKTWAVAWLTPVDTQTGEVIPTEPGLTVVLNVDGEWKAILPADPSWSFAVQTAPTELLPEEEKDTWLALNAARAVQAYIGPFGGYYLPWAGGESMALTQSVAHDRYTPSGNAHYAFDFAYPGPASMFNLYAAKAGTVKMAKDSCTNGSTTCSNYIVLEDITTNPTTYQLYLHLAKDSIPTDLHAVGAPVVRGQFIGVADDSGVSTNHHLHFMVHTYPLSYWGTSVDITFVDVAINGGRPRITADLPYCRNNDQYRDVCTQTQTVYVSGNTVHGDRVPPQGTITSPQNGIVVEGSSLTLAGWAVDNDTGLGSAQFIARYGNAWHDIGPAFTASPFSMGWDLCSSAVPDGPVSLALRLRDQVGNQTRDLPGLVHFSKNSSCPSPPPACVPAADQIALFAEPDYGGACQLLGAGNYPSSSSFSTVGDNDAASIAIGGNIIATLFTDTSYRGRGESFTQPDSNLADNLVGANQLSSLIVHLRSQSPAAPILMWPVDGATFPAGTSLSLVWGNAGGARSYQLELNGVSKGWQPMPYYPLGSLANGSYRWRVRSRNLAGESGWSNIRTLNISNVAPSEPVVVSVPFSDDMEDVATKWTKSNNWDLNAEENHTPEGKISWKYDVANASGYDNGLVNSGDLTSPVIQIPTTGEYFLRFWYIYETESPGVHWDQRWIQVAVDGGRFANLLQLSDDPSNVWLQSPAIPLSNYAGKDIQIRFHFETLDTALNDFRGWFIDDFSVSSDPPEACSDNDNTPAQATLITYGAQQTATICPSGDVDYYRFNASPGEQVGVYLEAQSFISPLDTYLFLLDSDGRSVLVENDDQVPYERTDSYATYRVRRGGDYFLKVKAWNHPSAGGSDHSYVLNLVRDDRDPNTLLVYPQTGSVLTGDQFIIQLTALDGQSGVSHVEFLWHDGDWQNSDWRFLGSDWNGQDGWKFKYDQENLLYPRDIAIYARVYDWAGNWIGVGAWNLNKSKKGVFLPIITRAP